MDNEFEQLEYYIPLYTRSIILFLKLFFRFFNLLLKYFAQLELLVLHTILVVLSVKLNELINCIYIGLFSDRTRADTRSHYFSKF